MVRWGEQRERMAEDVAVLAEDDGGAPGDEDVLLAVCDGETVGDVMSQSLWWRIAWMWISRAKRLTRWWRRTCFACYR